LFAQFRHLIDFSLIRQRRNQHRANVRRQLPGRCAINDPVSNKSDPIDTETDIACGFIAGYKWLLSGNLLSSSQGQVWVDSTNSSFLYRDFSKRLLSFQHNPFKRRLILIG
jgi:hypothetical protein